jgi:hypothetical protein
LEDLLDPLDQEVHHERSGQTVFIILVSERQVDHGAIVGGALSCRSDLFFFSDQRGHRIGCAAVRWVLVIAS